MNLFADIGDQRRFVGKAPSAGRLQFGQHFKIVWPFRVGAVIRTPGLGDQLPHFRISAQLGAHLAFNLLGLFQAGLWRHRDREPNVALVELGQKFAAQKRHQHHG